ncbi:flocculation protein FLO11 [Coregonus clupeaformis]|uniref:flocculation protein FLO11 n=1 Tax=Coregonus clupeaformis TaxID=59861 RepID=UPI001BE0AF3F|nr:flocculation protein FLO11 [Coregonus clupeaformis]XP_041756360.1 flocculation protein FLO11 [Coregonus clupeaformis]
MSSSSETCPFCGKNFKRLNSHLPRCKMAPVATTTQSSQTPPGPPDLITDKNSKKTSLSLSSSSPSTTSTKSKKTSSLSPSPALSPLAITTKSKKTSSSLTTTKNSKKAPSPSSSSSSTTSKKRQKLLDETLVLSKDSLAKDPAKTHTKPKAIAKLKAAPVPATAPLSTKAKAASKKKVSLREQIELSTQTARAAATLSQESLSGAQSEARPFWKVEVGSSREEVGGEEKLQCSGSGQPRPSIQDHTTLKPDWLYSKTTALDHNPTITADLNKDSLRSKTSNRGLLTVNHVSSVLDRVQTTTADRNKDYLCNKTRRLLTVDLGQTSARTESATANQSVTREKAPFDTMKYGTEQRIMGTLSLGEVRLKELPGWIATRAPRNPRNGVQALNSGWQWYYRRYIDVRKGGVGGVAMLLAGYCILGYTWHYPHIKHDRWRKYH